MATLDADDLTAIAGLIAASLPQNLISAISVPTFTVSSANVVLVANKIENSSDETALQLTSGSSTIKALLVRAASYDAIIAIAGTHTIESTTISGGSNAIALEGSAVVNIIADTITATEPFASEGAYATPARCTVSAKRIIGDFLFELSAPSIWDITADVIDGIVDVGVATCHVTIRGARLSSNVSFSAGSLTLIDCVLDGNLTQSGTGVIRRSESTIVLGSTTGVVSVIPNVQSGISSLQAAVVGHGTAIEAFTIAGGARLVVAMQGVVTGTTIDFIITASGGEVTVLDFELKKTSVQENTAVILRLSRNIAASEYVHIRYSSESPGPGSGNLVAGSSTVPSFSNLLVWTSTDTAIVKAGCREALGGRWQNLGTNTTERWDNISVGDIP